MYTVVGCRECHALWIVEGRPKTTRCSRCGKRHRFERLRAFAETDRSDAAARIRSSMLAERSGDGEFVDPSEIDVEGVGMDEVEFLSASGIDTESVVAAASRAEEGNERSRSRRQVVLDGLDELEEPSDERLVEYAAGSGVPGTYVRRALEKLQQAGTVIRSDGVYRKL